MLAMSLAAVISGATTVAIAVSALMGLSVQLPAFLLVLCFMGGATAFMLVPYRTIVQEDAPPDRIGRVFAAGEAVITTTMLAAPLIGSFIASQWGTPVAFVAGGVVLVVLGADTLASHRGA
jgi:MFS family permease